MIVCRVLKQFAMTVSFKHPEVIYETMESDSIIDDDRISQPSKPMGFHGIQFAPEPGSKFVVLGMAIPPLIGNPYNGYINPYYWVDDHPLLYGNNGSLDPSTPENGWLEFPFGA